MNHDSPAPRDPERAEAGAATDPGEFCRAVEAYLCRKNEGQLVRIVGPAFDCVNGWATRGIPLRVAYRGIDRTVERHLAKVTPRRRPVRVEFCDADVLDVFDEWRRAIGVPAAGPEAAASGAAGRRHESLALHLERVVARLTALRASGGLMLNDVVDPLVSELDGARASAKALRGEARRQLLDRLRALDTQLVDSARARVDAGTLDELSQAAEEELSAFRDRMPREAYEQARLACVDRLMRDRFNLPTVALD